MTKLFDLKVQPIARSGCKKVFIFFTLFLSCVMESNYG